MAQKQKQHKQQKLTIIEFVGAPASGKTTLCSALHSHMLKNEHRAKNMWRVGQKLHFLRLRYKFLFADKELKELLYDYIDTLSDKKYAQFYADRILEFAYLVKLAKTKRIGKHHVHYALFNEGCVQFLAEMSAGEPLDNGSAELVQKIKDTVYKDCVTVLVQTETDEQTNLDRLINESRHAAEYAGMSEEDIIAILRNTKANIETAVAQFGFRKHIRIAVKDNLAEELHTLLHNLRHGEDAPKRQSTGTEEKMWSLHDWKSEDK